MTPEPPPAPVEEPPVHVARKKHMSWMGRTATARARAAARERTAARLRDDLRQDPRDLWWHPYGRAEGILLGTVEDMSPDGRIAYRSPHGYTGSVMLIEGWVRLVPRRAVMPVRSGPVAPNEGRHQRQRTAVVSA